MAVTKINVARTPKALTFSIEELPSTLGHDDRSKFVWGEFVDLTADQILQVPPPTDDDSDATTEWLKDALAEGALRRSKLIGMAEARSIPERDVEKAANALRVVRDGEMWRLPDDEQEMAS